VTGIIKSHFGAYGAGVEYATTLVHGGAPTALPRYEVPGRPAASADPDTPLIAAA
jgi:hypothetical protein